MWNNVIFVSFTSFLPYIQSYIKSENIFNSGINGLRVMQKVQAATFDYRQN